MQPLDDLITAQDGVVSRRQLLDRGLGDGYVERALRRRTLRRLHPGVYVDHTGPPTWRQRAWAAVLFHEPAALCHESALIVAGHDRGFEATGPIHVLVPHGRRVTPPPGVVLHRTRHFEAMLHPSRLPPRQVLEHAVIDVASSRRESLDAVALLADVCGARRTTAARLVAALRDRPVLPRRAFLLEVLADVATGAYSVLEHRYLVRVERSHRLPVGQRQAVAAIGPRVGYRDVAYDELGVVIELDGRLGHSGATEAWRDLHRDVASAVAGQLTVRLGWRQVEESCRTAAALAQILAARGWRGRPRRCGSDCAMG